MLLGVIYGGYLKEFAVIDPNFYPDHFGEIPGVPSPVIAKIRFSADGTL
jgi:hypothetical protein